MNETEYLTQSEYIQMSPCCVQDWAGWVGTAWHIIPGQIEHNCLLIEVGDTPGELRRSLVDCIARRRVAGTLATEQGSQRVMGFYINMAEGE